MRDEIIIISEQSKALKSEGERPAKSTKSKMARRRGIKRCLLPNTFPMDVPARDEKKERCIPLSARIWDKPADLKASEVFSSVYSRAPERSERINAPALPHALMSLLKVSLSFPLK